MKEIWKDIPDYEGLYQVSNLGNIKTFNWKNKSIVRIMSTFDNGGYKRICLTKDGIKSHHLVHRLVAKAFISNPDNKPYINHIDGNKQNNTVTNLEWCTQKESVHHAIENHLRPIVCHPKRFRGGKNPCSKKVIQKTIHGELVNIWDCSQDAADALGFNKICIQRCCRKERKLHHGYIWEYVNNSNNK